MTWSNETKNTTVFSRIAKNLATFGNTVKHILGSFFLLKEDGFYLLLEDGGKIILEDSMIWTNEVKNTT